MRVLMTADAAGGVWTYVLELVDALAPHGVEVTLATTGPRLRPHQREELRSAAVASAHTRELRLEWMEDPWSDLEETARWLLELRDEVAPDVVHLNGFVHGGLEWNTPCLVVGHSCVLSWFRAVRGEAAPPGRRRYRDAVRLGIAGADVLVTPSRALLRELERLYEPTCERLVIPNGRSVQPVTVDEQPFVLAAGRVWDDAKNVAALDRVAPSLPWPVLVAGDLDPRRPLQNAHALGPLSGAALARTMARAPIFVAPARYEPFGYCALEAALHGCALVLGDIASLREVWGEAALFVDPDDGEGLAAAIALLAEEKPLRDELASRARDRARMYTSERMAGAYLELYERLVPQRRQPEGAAVA